MTYLLDTDVIISHLNKKYVLPAVPTDPPAISVITYGELLYGIEKSKNPTKRERLDGFLQELRMALLPVTGEIMKRFTAIKLEMESKGERLADFDLLIDATAIEHNLTLITGNKTHFQRIHGLHLV